MHSSSVRYPYLGQWTDIGEPRASRNSVSAHDSQSRKHGVCATTRLWFTGLLWAAGRAIGTADRPLQAILGARPGRQEKEWRRCFAGNRTAKAHGVVPLQRIMARPSCRRCALLSFGA